MTTFKILSPSHPADGQAIQISTTTTDNFVTTRLESGEMVLAVRANPTTGFLGRFAREHSR